MKDILENGRLVWRLMKDDRVPTWVKVAIPVLIATYFISPIDVIPDFLLGLGQLDDLGVILFGMSLIVRFSPPAVVEEHRRAIEGHSYAANVGTNDTPQSSGYWASPPARKSGEAARSIEGEYRVVPPGDNC